MPETIQRILQHLGLSTQPKGPDPHYCEDRDPDVAARHPLFHAPPGDSDAGTDVSGAGDWPVADPDYEWPMDAPHAED